MHIIYACQLLNLEGFQVNLCKIYKVSSANIHELSLKDYKRNGKHDALLGTVSNE